VIHLATSVREVMQRDDHFYADTSAGAWQAQSFVVASGGLSIPKMKATGFGYDVARQFGLPITPLRAGLVPFTLEESLLKRSSTLSGIAVESVVECGRQRFEEGLLFTHRGLSGPAILQISSYWEAGQAVTLNLCPDQNVEALLLVAKASHPKQELNTLLSEMLPKRVAGFVVESLGMAAARMADMSHARVREVAERMTAWRIVPHGTEGYRTAEVTKGGVDTTALSSQTMESRDVRGLYFIGEVVDVTGYLGGYNFQWAWASGHAAGMAA
jgi:predicted Rossmann fold flavoprotein